ncbi:hypothetical protein M8013_06130 [Enterobacteriaceae bacterium H4N4]|uniref:Uncharacterized protein n=1 Tax=Silvania confinis TaxID=2926470 RepID=A0A9J6QJ09_9ENTR|nr:hypothetical protein [Silvania confinis]MCU6668333.1 hypothetical protein [Silvania confinis]
MKKALMQWIKKQISFAFWAWIPFLVMMIFAVLAAHYLPRELALKSIAAFIVLTMAYVFFRK